MCLSILFMLIMAVTASAQTVDAIKNYKPDQKGFIRDWLVGGAYPNYQVSGKQQGYEDDFLKNSDGEALAEPYPGLKDSVTFKADKSKLIAGIGSTNEWGYTEDKVLPVTWRIVNCTQTKPEIVFDKMFLPVDDYIVAYAFCYIESPTVKKIKIRLGSDDDHKVWLNGKLLGGVNKSQGIIPDNFIYDAELQRGLNRLMLKVVDRNMGYGFCLAVSDRDNLPLSEVNIILDDPKRQKMNNVTGLRRIDGWDHGFYAGFNFSSKDVFKGKNSILIQAGVPRAGKYKFVFTAAGKSGNITREEKNAELKDNELLKWELNPTLPEGKVALKIAVSGDGDAELVRNIEVFDQATLQRDNATMKTTLDALEPKLAAVKQEKLQNSNKIKELQQQREQLYNEIENAYAEQRKKLRSAPAAIDEAITPATTDRTMLCLNGDQWQMAAANGNMPPAPDKWIQTMLPLTLFDSYFRTWFYPLRNVDPKNVYGKVESISGWQDFKFNQLICAPKLWFRKEIILGNEAEQKAHSLIFEHVNGKIKVFLNGGLCGEFFGNIGIVEIPLKGVTTGKNLLDIYLESPISAGMPRVQPPLSDIYGIRGDLYLKSTAKVNVSDTTVKTSWRKGAITTATTVENRDNVPAEIRLEQYCVLNNRIKYRFPAQNSKIVAGGNTVLVNNGIWLEAEPWGIGGKYGNPTMYDLVSDLYVGSKLIDRQVTPFGFREFWITGTDFYLNGKRIILQGDVGLAGMNNVKMDEVVFPLLRADGINTLRNHDSDYWSINFLRACDRLGMLVYAQMHPLLNDKKQPDNFAAGSGLKFSSYEEWLKNPLHQYNLRNYERWEKMLRNHPSVIIASTDNEIFTQAWDTLEREAFNIRNDKVGAFYGRYVKSLNPALIITRDGDEGTWGHKGKWQENPLCDTANYHYPDFNVNEFVQNWQSVYDFRPAVFGETLYCSYGAWDNWIGPIPSQVAKKAALVRKIASLYRELGIPGQIYMGLSSDGFVGLDDTGKGNPWKVTAAMDQEYKTKKMIAGMPGYPWMKIEWPSYSGSGQKTLAKSTRTTRYGHDVLNWFDATAPSHVRNAVNDAYRDSLIPQPPLAPASGAECIIDLGADNRGKTVSAIPLENVGQTSAVTADANGTAWFHLPSPGKYRFECEGKNMTVVLSKREGSDKPGFKQIPRYQLNK
jgi:hypothetical protein